MNVFSCLLLVFILSPLIPSGDAFSESVYSKLLDYTSNSKFCDISNLQELNDQSDDEEPCLADEATEGAASPEEAVTFVSYVPLHTDREQVNIRGSPKFIC